MGAGELVVGRNSERLDGWRCHHNAGRRLVPAQVGYGGPASVEQGEIWLGNKGVGGHSDQIGNTV